MSDKYSRKIINFINDSPKSAIQISTEANIELSLVYRRLQRLKKCCLVDTSIRITPEGKKSYLYQGRIRGINVHYLDDLVEVDMIANSNIKYSENADFGTDAITCLATISVLVVSYYAKDTVKRIYDLQNEKLHLIIAPEIDNTKFS